MGFLDPRAGPAEAGREGDARRQRQAPVCLRGKIGVAGAIFKLNGQHSLFNIA
jgi:hypothetical protein